MSACCLRESSLSVFQELRGKSQLHVYSEVSTADIVIGI